MDVTDFWTGKTVFLTGHTGFMGGWLTAALLERGALVHGYALAPPTEPSFFKATSLEARMASSTIADVRDEIELKRCLNRCKPAVVFHLAAQPLVREAYRTPVDTFATNIMGTANILEAVRTCSSVRAVAVVTTDKVYRNCERKAGYTEDDELGGREPYSASKAAAEFVAGSYYRSYLEPAEIGLATIRAGNIFGGGDWAAERLVPDAVRAFSAGQPLVLRNPASIRPWQHVADPVIGYLQLCETLAVNPGDCSGAWNFGPAESECWPVGTLAKTIASLWGPNAMVEVEEASDIFEHTLLSLDCSKAARLLSWHPKWGVAEGLSRTVDWHKAMRNGEDMWALTQNQLRSHAQYIGGTNQ